MDLSQPASSEQRRFRMCFLRTGSTEFCIQAFQRARIVKMTFAYDQVSDIGFDRERLAAKLHPLVAGSDAGAMVVRGKNGATASFDQIAAAFAMDSITQFLSEVRSRIEKKKDEPNQRVESNAVHARRNPGDPCST